MSGAEQAASPEYTMEFSVNQIVRGVGSTLFVILAFRTIDGERYAQVKEVHPITHKPARGEFAIPASVLRPAA